MTKTQAFDFGSVDLAAACEKPFELQLVNPVTKDPIDAWISVVGKEGETFKNYVRSRANERLRLQNFQQQRGKEPEAPRIEKIEEDAIDLLVACTVGWRGVVVDGAPLEFSKANAKALYTRFAWAREQVDVAIGDVTNFITA